MKVNLNVILKDNTNNFLRDFETELVNSVGRAGQSIARSVREKTPIAVGYPRAGKLRKFIRADASPSWDGRVASITIASYARTKDARKADYGMFVEHGSPTIQAYGMFQKTKDNDLPKIIAINILKPLIKVVQAYGG